MTGKPWSPRLSSPGLWIGLVWGVALAGAPGCGRPGGPSEFSASHPEFPIPDSGVVTPPPSVIAVQKAAPACTPARTSAPNAFPARTTIVGDAPSAAQQNNTYRTADLFSLFKSVCGGCHVDAPDGGFQVTQSNFSTIVKGAMGTMVLGLIKSNDLATNMPPYNVAYDSRLSSDAVVQLATLLETWLMQGSPLTSFTLATQTSAPSAGYSMSPSLAAGLTNIGSCVPNKPAVGTSAEEMNQLDSFFAQATALPATLDQTDLISLDSEVLAKTGVISYAPTYPLWSDNAGKMRYVRVPAGKSIVFDKSKQTFTIPANTRFYKTFLKEVIDANGNPAFRKIETRLIVSRPDTTNSDGSAQQNALFGTYIWNADESQATLSNQPLRNNSPFADQIFTYITDEAKDQTIIAGNPANLPAAEDAAKITRHYAVPGATRCIQCHMGSPSASFVLGFTPLQVARRPEGEGGVYEAASGDELTQVQRLIDYGVITGLTSQADILPLERSEGTRQPRNVHELNAQAYMVGNCAHCHNPRGFPSIRQPLVADVLKFLPGPGPNEGIFQFPLEAMSPLRNRGVNQDVKIPYITPSLYDMPSDEAIPKYFCPNTADPTNCKSGLSWILAPWRSLIYRNTDTPYDYFDDYAPFPHMPLNTSGYDCRVAKLMGDWMVSIPSRVKNPSKPQNLLPNSTENGTFAGSNANDDPQPYEEVHPGDSDYAAAVGAADARMQLYHTRGFRYGFCPPTYTDDIVDPVIVAQANANVTVTSDVGLGTPSAADPKLLVMSPLAPIRPHYVSQDDTDPPGDWLPRRPDWATALVNPNIASFVKAEDRAENLTDGQVEDLTNVLTALQNVKLTPEIRSALTQKYGFGLWDTKTPGCNFSGVLTAGSFGGADRPQWMAVAPPPDDAPVFVESSGAAIFTTICFNCHGPNADAQGLLADEISTLTGGDARVANFRDGFLGPLATPSMNRTAVFGSAAATLGVTVDDLSARYMAWMALGGTNKHLPQDVLNEVTLSPVVGQVRAHVSLQGTPDMLRLGLNLCEQLVGADDNSTQISLQNFIKAGQMKWSDYTGLVDTNGDAEMWLRLCNLGNRQIVRALQIQGNWTAATNPANLYADGINLYWARGLPTATSPTGDDWYGGNPVMDHVGNVQTGVAPSNLFPMCVRPPKDAAQLQLAKQVLQASPVAGKNVIPLCPDGFVTPAHQVQFTSDGAANDYVEGRQWAARGAINAALAVFLYLDQMEHDPTQRQPLYTQCNLLGAHK